MTRTVCRSMTLLALSSILGSCGSDDDCPSLPRLDGNWQVTSGSIVMNSGSYIPIGLDNTAITLQFLASGQDADGCGTGYSVVAPGLNLTSPSENGAPLSMLVAQTSGMPDRTFLMSGVYYIPSSDVSVALANTIPFVVDTPSGFDLACRFSVYQGNVVVSLPDPDFPGEFYDDIAPGSQQLSDGSLILSFQEV